MNRKKQEEIRQRVIKRALLSEEEFSLLEEIVEYWNKHLESCFILDSNKVSKKYAQHLRSRGYIDYDKKHGIRPTWNAGVPLYMKAHPELEAIPAACLLPDSRGSKY